jgi:hypothetical protein
MPPRSRPPDFVQAHRLLEALCGDELSAKSINDFRFMLAIASNYSNVGQEMQGH